MTVYNDPTLWLTFAAIGIGTFASRFSFIYYFGRIEVPHAVMRLLRFVPPAVLSALILPSILMKDGHTIAAWENERFLAALVAALVSFRTRNMLLTICTGMGALWLFQAVL